MRINIKTVLKIVQKQWKQPSTLQGITVFASACGVALKPEISEAIMIGGTFIFTIVSMFVSEGKGTQDEGE